MEYKGTIDIYSKNPYPASALSNFAPHGFELDGVKCASMEGFLQSLKYRSPARQRKVCALVGKEAKKAGKYKFWWKITGKLRWQGRAIKRKSDEYGELLIRAYSALYLNLDFRAALEATQGYKLTHTSGKHERGRTVLTEEEFISLLERLRGSTETRKLSGKA